MINYYLLMMLHLVGSWVCRKAFKIVNHAMVTEKLQLLGISDFQIGSTICVSASGSTSSSVSSVVFFKAPSWDLFSFSYTSTT